MPRYTDRRAGYVRFEEDYVIPPCVTYKVESQEFSQVGTNINLAKGKKAKVFIPPKQEPHPWLKDNNPELRKKGK